MSFPFPRCSFPTDVPNEDDAALVASLGLSVPSLANAVTGKVLTFKAPQTLAYHFGMANKRFILSFDKGMGKTVTYLKIAQDSGAERVVILCTRNAMATQRREIRKYFPQWADSFIFVTGSADKRAQQWHSNAKVFICTYATFLADLGSRKTSRASGKLSEHIAPEWVRSAPMVICDEYHRVLRNRDTGMHKLLKSLNIDRLILSSGSAANKGPQSLWTALNTLAPKVFTSYWKYVYATCIVEDNRFGKQIIGVKNVQGFRDMTFRWIFHRKKDLKDYPKKTRQALEVEMEPWQKKIHDELKEQLLSILDSGDLLLAKNTLDATHRIRQLMICPRYLDSSLGYGAGLEAILEDAVESELSHWVISTPYIGPIPLIKQFFAHHTIASESLQGGMSPDEIDAAIARWTKNGGVIIQSIEFAESYELPAARIMYMLGYSQDPEKNSQAEDRIHRDIRVTPDPVDIYYIKHLKSYDERVVEAMSDAADNVHYLLNAPLAELFNL